MLQLKKHTYEGKNSLCCGGSIASIGLNELSRRKLVENATEIYKKLNPTYLITGCPLCKKTFSNINSLNVKDIAEITYSFAKKETVETTEHTKAKMHNLTVI